MSAGLTLRWLTADLPAPGELVARAAPDATKIYDRSGTVLYEVLDPRSGRRTRVPLADLPLAMTQAVVAVEDAQFFRHPGVDARGVVRAAVQMARRGRVVSGGSTITQQLARQVLLTDDERVERTIRRKLREMILALRISRQYSKEQVLEMYLNEVYFGQMAYGIEAASLTYFGKSSRDLDLAEAALLAGLIQSPAAYNPLVDIDAAKARQRTVLGLMVRSGAITTHEADTAGAEPLRLTGEGVPLHAPHFVTYVRDLLEARYGAEAVNGGGLHVVTTLDLDLQQTGRVRRGEPDGGAGTSAHPACRTTTRRMRRWWPWRPETGQILAMVGSADYFDAADRRRRQRRAGPTASPAPPSSRSRTPPPSTPDGGACGRSGARPVLPAAPALHAGHRAVRRVDVVPDP